MLKEYKINENLKEADVGYVVQAIGPVVDVRFDDGLTPSLKTALKLTLEDLPDKKELILEVSQDMGHDTVRCISMGPTEGIKKV